MTFSLPTLTSLLEQLLDPPDLHTAVLTTPKGLRLACTTSRREYESRMAVLAGLAAEMYQQNKDEDVIRAQSEVGKVLVMPLYPASASETANGQVAEIMEDPSIEPQLLIVLNGKDNVPWGVMHGKAQAYADVFAEPLAKYGDRLSSSPPLTAPKLPPLPARAGGGYGFPPYY